MVFGSTVLLAERRCFSVGNIRALLLRRYSRATLRSHLLLFFLDRPQSHFSLRLRGEIDRRSAKLGDMRFLAEDLWTWVFGHYPRNVFDAVMAYRVDGYWFAPSFRKGTWDGKKRFYSHDRKTGLTKFPSGFLGSLCAELTSRGMDYSVEDRRQIEPVDAQYVLLDDAGFPTVRLDEGKWSWQKDVLDSIILRGRGIVRVATSGGKTEIAAAAIKSYDTETLWLTSLKSLFYQTSDRLRRRLGVEIGEIGDGEFTPQKVNVAMVQTISSAIRHGKKHVIDAVQKAKMVVGDEFHHCESDQWNEILQLLTAPIRLGLTATTNLTGPALALRGMAGDVIADVTAQQLIRAGVAVPPRIWFAKVTEPKLDDKIETREAYKLGVVDSQYRNDFVCRIAATFAHERKPTLLLVNQVRHGKLLTKMLEERGVSAAFIWGSVKHQDRLTILSNLEQRRISVLVAMQPIMGEGVDAPYLRAVVNATGTRGGGNQLAGETGRVTVQILGRILRGYPGKTYCDYVDMADYTHRSLKENSFDRVCTLESEGYAEFVRKWEEYDSQPI